jgi:formylglycine-generating enzyme required for sulfatase activity
MPCDRYIGGSVLVHEFAHLMDQVGLARDKAFRRGLHDAFANATAKHLFQAKYPSTNEQEYWAVGVQSWFEANEPGERRSRAELLAADPPLAALAARVFPDDDWRPTCGLVEDPATPQPGPPPVSVDKPRACPAGMVSLAGGSFPSGPATVVQPFCMDANEVTVEAYAACARSGRCTPAGATVNVSFLSKEDAERFSASCNGNRSDRRHHPVNCVDWKQASTYCKVQGKRLPTEQEWEWAARGGAAASPYPWGFVEPKDQLCWSGVDPRDGTCEVGTHPAGDTPQGIHDLAGNVWEWTADTNEDGDPIVKGSGFNAGRAADARVSRRSDGPPGFRAHIGGLRCVR